MVLSTRVFVEVYPLPNVPLQSAKLMGLEYVSGHNKKVTISPNRSESSVFLCSIVRAVHRIYQ